jgi:hypothetical protein
MPDTGHEFWQMFHVSKVPANEEAKLGMISGHFFQTCSAPPGSTRAIQIGEIQLKVLE